MKENNADDSLASTSWHAVSSMTPAASLPSRVSWKTPVFLFENIIIIF